MASLTHDEYYEFGLALEDGDDNIVKEMLRRAGGDLNAIHNPDTGVPIILDIQVVDDPIILEWIIRTFRPDINIQGKAGYTILFDTRMPLQSLAVLIRYGIDVRHEVATTNVGSFSVVYDFALCGLVQHVKMLLENGAKLDHAEAALKVCGHNSSLQALVEKMRTRANRCYRVCLFFFELRKIRVLSLDMARVMAQMVWATRRQAEWDGK